ncbi:hypothetical protein GJA_660 [Janthinobacterium agaricidamnosum NBRC 102515 = DSM 9628]|uniref:Uncharacterized protein n=1 Tax=Janthinobacterium agaricidamnosum NBRC 102515 = DSM 9628 TaxID=1349767 RepID=W0UXP3_9BURK|nr:hypothetical protein GJA_660 [Janthinobacterium agaricidamnosum NBRC 102515 = DSM 9628]
MNSRKVWQRHANRRQTAYEGTHHTWNASLQTSFVIGKVSLIT